MSRKLRNTRDLMIFGLRRTAFIKARIALRDLHAVRRKSSQPNVNQKRLISWDTPTTTPKAAGAEAPCDGIGPIALKVVPSYSNPDSSSTLNRCGSVALGPDSIQINQQQIPLEVVPSEAALAETYLSKSLAQEKGSGTESNEVTDSFNQGKPEVSILSQIHITLQESLGEQRTLREHVVGFIEYNADSRK